MRRQPVRRQQQRLQIVALVGGLRQPQAKPMAQELFGRIGEQPAHIVDRNAGRQWHRRLLFRQLAVHPDRQRLPLAKQAVDRWPPLPTVAEAARVGAILARRTKRGGGEWLQRMPHHQCAGGLRIAMVRRGGGQQFADQQRRFTARAVARIGAEIAQVEHLLGGSKQLQEQETVIVAGGAITMAATLTAQFGSEPVESGRRVTTREIAIVHAQQTDHPKRQQPHRHHPAEADAAGEQRRTRVGAN
jgi:hypothetical protein